MNVRALLRNAPNSLIYAVTVVFVAIIAAFVVLAATGSDSTELRSFINTILNVAAVALSGGGVVVAGAAARSADRAVKQTNGLSDDERQDIARRAAAEALAKHGQAPVE